MIGKSIFGVVECKYFNKKIDVKVVEGFIGFMEDVGTNVGIIITNKGYSQAALNRAEVRKIHLDIVEISKLSSYHFEWDSCHDCYTLSGRMHSANHV